MAETTPMRCNGAHVVINEWLANPTGDDAGREWIELANESNEPVQLGGAELRIGAPWALRGRILPAHTEIAPGGYLLVGDGTAASRARASGAEVAVTYGGVELPNDAGRVELWCGQQLLAQVEYGAQGPAPAPVSGHATARMGPLTESYCNVVGPPYDGRDQGSPNAANPACVRCQENGEWRPVRWGQAGDLVVDSVRHARATRSAGASRSGSSVVSICAQHAVDLFRLRLQVQPDAGLYKDYVLAGDACAELLSGQCAQLPVLAPTRATGTCLRGAPWPRAASTVILEQGDVQLGQARLSACDRAGEQQASRCSAELDPPDAP